MRAGALLRRRRRELLAILAVIGIAAASLAGSRSEPPGAPEASRPDRKGPVASPREAASSLHTLPPTPPPTGDILPPPPARRVVTARVLTSGSEILKPGSSVRTAVIRPRPGGLVLAWVVGMLSDPAPIPSLSGAGLRFGLVASQTKKEGATRRLSLFAAPVPPRPRSGSITIDFGREYDSSQWLWVVVQVDGARIAQVATNGEGNLATSHDVRFSRPTRPGHATLVGFLIGNSNDPVPRPPMRELTRTLGDSPPALIFVQWTVQSVSGAACAWEQPGHAIGIGAEIAP